MKKLLRMLIVLSIAASSIFFTAPSQAATVGGVDVTVSGNVTIASSSANELNLHGSSYNANDAVIFDFGGSSFSVANMDELSFGSTVGIPSTPEVGYNKTINMVVGLGYYGMFDIFYGGSAILQGICPSGPGFSCSGQGANRAFTPFIQLNYTASSGVLSVRVPVTSGTGASITINTNGTFSLGSGTVTSWVELTNFVVGAGATTVAGAPTSVTATSTGATTANVSFTAPASNGGATITSYTATSSPGGITGSISQAGSGTIAITGLTAGTSYTFTVTATNSAGTSAASTASNSVTTVGAPTAPTSVVATLTGKRNATVSFAVPASNGGSAVTSYTVTSTPGGITQTLTQATGGIFNFDGLQPNTSYAYAVTATNALGTSTAAISNSIKTTAADIASLSSLTFTNDGTGTAGKLAWAGKNIDLIRYAGDKSSYPYPFNYSAYTPTYDGTSRTWDGSLINLLPGTKYSATIYALSSEGVGESETIEFTTTTATAPAKVKSVVAKATGSRSAIVTFTSPEDDGNSPITSYKVVASPGNKSQTFSQASGASLAFSDLEPETDYTFSVTAINKIGSSLLVLSNSVTTTALVIPSIDNISFTDDGSGTGGAIKWTGKNIASVKFLGSANNYPVNLSYGEHSTSWNGRVRNLTPDIEMTFSISVMSEDGVQVTKSIIFKTGPSLVNKISNFLLKNAPLKEGFQSDEIIVANQIPTIYNLIDLNATFRGESVKIKSLLSKFNNIKVYKQTAYLRLPTARQLNTKALSQSPQVCTVENQNIVRSIAPGYCVIAFTVTGLSQEPATLVKSFEFLKYAKI